MCAKCFFFQAEDGIRDYKVTGVQTCALPIWSCFGDYLGSRAAVSGEGIAYNSPASFADPVGVRDCNTYISSRGPDGWSTKNVTPLHLALEGGAGGLSSPPFDDMYFTPDLSEGILTEQTNPLTSDTPAGGPGQYFESVYRVDFASGSYQ